jgi:hypothetical protein
MSYSHVNPTRANTAPVKFWFARKLMLFLILGAAGSLLAATKQTPPAKVEGQASSSAPSLLQVTINPSTRNIIVGAVYGLAAELQNISDVPIYIDLERLLLSVQPEVAPSNVSCGWSYHTYYTRPILKLLPGDHTTAFFYLGGNATPEMLKQNPECAASLWSRIRRRVDFVPDKYAFVITGNYTLSPPAADDGSESNRSEVSSSPMLEQHHFSEVASLPVSIDQAQMVVYAGFGGLLAFLVMSFRKGRTLSDYAAAVQASSSKPPAKAIVIARGVASAILLSATVTVIAARLSTTAFPVKVTIDDFWGSLTVGFVSFFVGGKFIDKLSETLTPPAKDVPVVSGSGVPLKP